MTLISGYRNFPVVVRKFGEVVDLIKDDQNKPNYIFGHPNEIVRKLADLSKSYNYSQTKFPLIALFQDFEEDVMEEGIEVRLNVIIANTTKPEYWASDRYNYNFEPILYPLLQQLERALEVSKVVQVLNNSNNQYQKTDRLYWGRQGLYGNEGNMFNDYIDAIEINNLNLRFSNNCI